MGNHTDNNDDSIEYIRLDTDHDDGIELLDADGIGENDMPDTAEDGTLNGTSGSMRDTGDSRMILIRRIVMCVSAAVFIFSAGMLIYIFMGYHKADKIYNSVENSVFTPVELPDSSDGETSAVSSDDSISSGGDTIISGFSYNHEALLEINTDSVGYIVIPSINICLPVVQGSDNSFYLTHAVTGSYSGNGTLFIDYRVEDGLEAANSIIYGHSMKNGSMFGSLYKLKNADFFSQPGNDTFYIYSGNNIYTYKIYSIHTTPAVSSTYTTQFADDTAFMDYIREMKEQSLVTTDAAIEPGAKTVTLSTCTDDDDTRLVVQAVRTETHVQE